jgi:hypothetical protein
LTWQQHSYTLITIEYHINIGGRVVSTVRNVYNGLDELTDFLPADLLNEILDILNSDLNWTKHEVSGRTELKLASYTSCTVSNIENFLKQRNLITEDEFVSSANLWRDDSKKVDYDSPFFIPLHIDPYKKVYKSIQLYLDDSKNFGSVWFNTDMYHKFYNVLDDAVLIGTNIPDSYAVYVNDKMYKHNMIKGKSIKYGKNRGYMLTNSLTNPLPHAVQMMRDNYNNRNSLYIIIESNDYLTWKVNNIGVPIGGFRHDKDLPD